MESDFAGLSLNEEEETILQIPSDLDPVREEGVFRLVGCFLTAIIIHFQAMRSTMANLWHPVKGVQIRDLGERSRLGHSDSFCETKMELGMEITDMGWDLSLRAQSKRVQAMTSVWLREDGDRLDGSYVKNPGRGNSGWAAEKGKSRLDPILGLNLEGKLLSEYQLGEVVGFGQDKVAMDHDWENNVLIGEEGKKRTRGENDESNVLVHRNKLLLELSQSAAATRQADRQQ
ncbi:hypothetical protein J1N35_043171 [Gossypium stocksii]|uniref:DUF4283 domain-containing protein n=1 Tax=Gossypium stocksii TaxID=47602 RepID=A0A9D3ZEN2_9ROSI|nr:hypothetical protein J1N35_043171 [Gossypium stocksii]